MLEYGFRIFKTSKKWQNWVNQINHGRTKENLTAQLWNIFVSWKGKRIPNSETFQEKHVPSASLLLWIGNYWEKYPTHDFKGRPVILHVFPITRPHFHWLLFCMTPKLESFSVCQKEGTPVTQTLSEGLALQVLHLLISCQMVTWLQIT